MLRRKTLSPDRDPEVERLHQLYVNAERTAKREKVKSYAIVIGACAAASAVMGGLFLRVADILEEDTCEIPTVTGQMRDDGYTSEEIAAMSDEDFAAASYEYRTSGAADDEAMDSMNHGLTIYGACPAGSVLKD